jgi:tRNA-dihydrouridine synthase
MSHIWQALLNPIFVLAPMEDVTDTVFRRVIVRCGRPDIFFTEFVNVEGLVSKGRDQVRHRLEFTPLEQPLIAQIWGEHPENFRTIAEELARAGFAGIDINMGCPERNVVRRSCGAGLISRPEHAVAIIQATKAGAGDLPVSIKTRCGVSEWQTETWARILLEQDLAALTIHGRIAKEMSHFPARWEEIAKVVKLRNQMGVDTKIIGNGDVVSYQDGLDKVDQFGVDGVMVGRGIFHNPWLFDPQVDPTTKTKAERLDMLRFHLELWQETWFNKPDLKPRHFEALKKFYKVYLRDFDGASDLRNQLMQLHDVANTLTTLSLYASTPVDTKLGSW